MWKPIWLVAAVLALAGCGRDEQQVEVRAYAVFVERTEEVAKSLNAVLGGDEHTEGVGRAWVGVPGQVLVRAPAGVQASIDNAIRNLLDAEGGAAASVRAAETVQLAVWVIDAIPGEGESDADLGALSEVFAEFERERGSHRYRLDDTATLGLAAGPRSHGLARGRSMDVRANVGADANGYPVELELVDIVETKTGEEYRDVVKTRLVLRADEFVVLTSRPTDTVEAGGTRLVVVQLRQSSSRG